MKCYFLTYWSSPDKLYVVQDCLKDMNYSISGTKYVLINLGFYVENLDQYTKGTYQRQDMKGLTHIVILNDTYLTVNCENSPFLF